MKIFVKVKPRARAEEAERADEAHFKVAVREPPAGGKANEAVRKVLAKYFDVAISRVRIVSGRASKQKIIEIT